jgi:hypothetical protein
VPELLAKHPAQAPPYLGTANLAEARRPRQRWLSWPEVAALPDDRVELILGRRLADPYGNPFALPRLQVRREHDEQGFLNWSRLT